MKKILLFILLSVLYVNAQSGQIISYVQQSPTAKAYNDFDTVIIGQKSPPLILGFCSDDFNKEYTYKVTLTGPFYFEDGTQLKSGKGVGMPRHITVYFKPTFSGISMGTLSIEGPNYYQAPLKATQTLTGVGRAAN